MRSIRRSLFLAAAVFGAAGLLRAQDTDLWSVELGAVVPSGGARQWVGSTTGVSLDFMQSFSLSYGDILRLRLGYFDLKGPSTTPQTVAFPNTAVASYPFSSSNELFGFSYGADYLHPFRGGAYVFGGAGYNYLTASRKGTLDLTAQGSGPVGANYDANALVPYLCAGAGYQPFPFLALEARYLVSSLRDQPRGLTYTAPAPPAGGVAQFGKVNVTTLTLGLVFNF